MYLSCFMELVPSWSHHFRIALPTWKQAFDTAGFMEGSSYSTLTNMKLKGKHLSSFLSHQVADELFILSGTF